MLIARVRSESGFSLFSPGTKSAGPVTAGYNQLRDQIMRTCDCSKRTAQLAMTQASEQGRILRDSGRYRLPSDFAAGSRRLQTPPAG